jgi:RND family efflux transporter MFP subunit
MHRKQILTTLVGLVIIGLAVVLGAGTIDQNVEPTRAALAARTIRAEQVELSTSPREVRLPGVTRSTRRAALSFTVPARMAARPVDTGDSVRAGQIVARVDDAQYSLAHRGATAALAELDVRLAQAQRDQARVARLVEARAATSEELEEVASVTASLMAAREAAASRVEETTRLLRETILYAPFDGIITLAEAESGEWVSPGSTVVELSGSEGTEVRVEVPESILPLVTTGSPVVVDLPMSDRTVKGRVVSVAHASTGPGSLFPIIVALDKSLDLAAGLAAEVVLSLQSRAELTVPLAAVIDSGSRHPSVFLVSGGTVRRITITPGRVLGERLTVSSSELAEGDMVAVLGHTALVDGDEVEVR